MPVDTHWLPWQTYDALTLERLRIIADLLREARDSAQDDHRPQLFEGALSLGVRAWERSKGAICLARAEHTWLHIDHGGGMGATHFIFSIGGFSCRFYHGAPDEPPSRYRMITFEERTAQGAFSLGQIPDGHALRFSVVTGSDMRTESIHLIEYIEAEQRTIRAFEIPLSTAALGGSWSPPAPQPMHPPSAGITLAPPTVTMAADEETIVPPAANDAQ